MRWAGVILAFAATSTACTPNPGRLPDKIMEKPDAGHDADAYPDASPYDAGFLDAAMIPDGGVLLADTGVPPPHFPFTGVYGIIGSADVLYAREVEGHLDVLVGTQPYNYMGTIDPGGHLDLTSDVLVRGGCDAHLTGLYMRDFAGYALHHKTCNAQGQPIESDITGAFAADYELGWSGVYEVMIVAVMDPMGCLLAMPPTGPFHWAMNFLSDNTMSVYMATDTVDQQSLYVGSWDRGSGQLNAIQRFFPQAGSRDVSLSGAITQVTTQQQPMVSGERDVIEFASGCGFRVAYSGTRILAP